LELQVGQERRGCKRQLTRPRKIWVVAGDGSLGAVGALVDITASGLGVRFDRRAGYRLTTAIMRAHDESALVHVAGLASGRYHLARVAWLDRHHPLGLRIGLELDEPLSTEEAESLGSPGDLAAND
jgi:hypothetical protein